MDQIADFACISEQEGTQQSSQSLIQDIPDEHWRSHDLAQEFPVDFHEVIAKAGECQKMLLETRSTPLKEWKNGRDGMTLLIADLSPPVDTIRTVELCKASL